MKDKPIGGTLKNLLFFLFPPNIRSQASFSTGDDRQRRRVQLPDQEAASTSPSPPMAIASSQQSFLTSGTPLACIQKHHHHHHHRRRPESTAAQQLLLGCRASMGENTEPSPSSSADEMRLAKLAMVAAAAGVLTLGSVGDAMAAKSGGRVGGQAFRPSAPKYSGPRINNSRTNIYINPPVAPPLVGGYGFRAPFYGGWGWSPFTFFAPGPSVAVGVGGGFDIFVLFLVLGAVATVIRGFTGRREDEDDY